MYELVLECIELRISNKLYSVYVGPILLRTSHFTFLLLSYYNMGVVLGCNFGNNFLLRLL